MLGVLCGMSRLIYGPQEDGFIGGIGNPFTFRVGRQRGRLTSSCRGQSGVDAVYNCFGQLLDALSSLDVNSVPGVIDMFAWLAE